MIRHVALALTLYATSGCVSAGDPPAGRERSTITVEEIAASTANSVFELVERLRPEYLRVRGEVQNPAGSSQGLVYVNGMRAGGFDILRSMRPQNVQEIRFLSAADATTRYGTGHTAGVIDIRTRGR